MSDQIPVPAVHAALPPVEISGAALVKFTIEMAARLRDLETRFAEPRQNRRKLTGEMRGASRRTR